LDFLNYKNSGYTKNIIIGCYNTNLILNIVDCWQ